MYVTQKPGLVFQRGGKYVTLPMGAPVPEAATLPTFPAMVRLGWIGFVDEGEANPPAVPIIAKKAKPAKEPKPVLAVYKKSKKPAA